MCTHRVSILGLVVMDGCHNPQTIHLCSGLQWVTTSSMAPLTFPYHLMRMRWVTSLSRSVDSVSVSFEILRCYLLGMKIEFCFSIPSCVCRFRHQRKCCHPHIQHVFASESVHSLCGRIHKWERRSSPAAQWRFIQWWWSSWINFELHSEHCVWIDGACGGFVASMHLHKLPSGSRIESTANRFDIEWDGPHESALI